MKLAWQVWNGAEDLGAAWRHLDDARPTSDDDELRRLAGLFGDEALMFAFWDDVVDVQNIDGELIPRLLHITPCNIRAVVYFANGWWHSRVYLPRHNFTLVLTDLTRFDVMHTISGVLRTETSGELLNCLHALELVNHCHSRCTIDGNHVTEL